MKKQKVLCVFLVLFTLLCTACSNAPNLCVDKNAVWICENPDIVLTPMVGGNKGVIVENGENVEFTFSTLYRSRMEFDFVVDGEEKSVRGDTTYNEDTTEIVFNVTSDDVFNQKYSSFVFKKKSTISSAFPDYNPYEIPRTYISLNTRSKKNKLTVVRGRLVIDLPMPQKFEHFENQVPYLYASMIYDESDYKYIINELGESESPTDESSAYAPLEKFEWWNIDENNLVYSKCNMPITLTYRVAENGPLCYSDAFRSIYFTSCEDGTYRMYCSYESEILYDDFKSGYLGEYAYRD